MSYDLLKKAVKAREIPHIMHFFGEESYLKHYYTNIIKKQTVDDFTADFNFVLFEDDITANALGTAIETPPVMSECKLVLVKNTGIFKGKSGNWSDILTDVPDYIHIIFDEDNFDKRSAAYKAVSKSVLSVEFKLRSRAELKMWANKMFAKNKKAISVPDLDYFLDVSGNDMYSVLAQSEKLFSYMGERLTITRNDIDTAVTKSLMTREYSLTDALLKQKKEESFCLLEQLFDMQAVPVRLLHIISSAFLSTYKAKVLLYDGLKPYEVSQMLGIPNKFISDKYVSLASSCDIGFLTHAIRLLTRADYDIKIGNIAPGTCVELVCADILNYI